MEGMPRNVDLSEFQRRCRARVTPESVGLPERGAGPGMTDPMNEASVTAHLERIGLPRPDRPNAEVRISGAAVSPTVD